MDRNFLTCEIEFVLFLAVLQNSVLPMGLDSSHATLKWRKKSLKHYHEKQRMTFVEGRYVT